MWSSSATALTAFFLLSNSVSAITTTITQTTEVVYTTIQPAPQTKVVYTTVQAFQESEDGKVYLPAPPKPVSAAAISSKAPSISTKIPSGIFFSGYASGSGLPTGSGLHFGTGTGGIRPTGGIPRNNTYSTVTVRRIRTASGQSSASQSSTPNTLSAVIPPASSTKPTSVASLPKSSSTSATRASSTVAPKPASTGIPFLRGVNLGGWLVLEKWMNNEAFSGAFSSASDQFTFDQLPGAAAALEKHWSTFFTEDDIKTIAATGINALRIPIGFWAYDNTNTKYLKGADVYLEKAIGWARTAGLKVWVDCHGSPGSQNGFDNSGKAGAVDWQQSQNLDASISVLKTMATKYGSNKYADVVVGLQMVNEPVSWGNSKIETTQSWTEKAYNAVRAVTENKNMMIVMHDGFVGAGKWTDLATKIIGSGSKTAFGVDTHLYQVFNAEDKVLTQSQHITKACSWSNDLKNANKVMPTFVGEWSPATDICVNPDGSTTAGTSCSAKGCQCQSGDFDKWNDQMIEQVRRFTEAQLDVFESSSSGYFMWAAKGPGGWGFLNGIKKGVIPNPVTDRKYPGQCGGKKRREVRGNLGREAEAW
ncbi:hypothetical protein HYFRA_00000774 [Hymenoscyphus fraxineus]|uniref:glucan 1,3-beta-glucosidase n=1 Tax=Hymenoscyphus fraxineus TaxID=746836 RepID=A0A9N9KS80_9HELO|nr:hypothetical protein HYFRA_00000774 [Hymenoscyphus fraxineus]